MRENSKGMGFYFIETLKFIVASTVYTLGRNPWVVKLLGLKYRPNCSRIEIDLTYACNLKCFNCNRSCTQAPTEEAMTIEQIKKFVTESIQNKIKWERIRLIGGEPTLHPDILEIMRIMLAYKNNFSPSTCIQLVTNGFGEKVNEVLRQVPSGIQIMNSFKQQRSQVFDPFNLAPQDRRSYRSGEYEQGCVNSSVCGISLNPYGYYCCGIAGGMDRIFGIALGRKSLPLSGEELNYQLRAFCKLCGIFASFKLIRKETMSISWQRAYERYKKERPKLTQY